MPSKKLPEGKKQHAASVIDSYFEGYWKEQKVRPAGEINDAQFLRRLNLVLHGAPTTAKELKDFLKNPSPDKRRKTIDDLLKSSRFADYFAFRLRQWVVDLREVKGQGTNLTTLYQYFRQAVAENRNWATIATDLIQTQGNIALDGRANFGVYFDGEPNEVADAASRLFLGTNLGCAQCHDHPWVDRWKRKSYWGLAAFFARSEMWDINVVGKDKFDVRFPDVGRAETSISSLPGGDASIDGGGGENRAYADVGKGEVTLPDPEDPQKSTVIMPTPLGGKPLKAADSGALSRRGQFAAWVVGPDNRRFPRSAVNRFWHELLGRGFVARPDDFRPDMLPKHDKLLDRLADGFRQRQYDIKWLIRTIVSSRVFRLAAEAVEGSTDKHWHGSLRRQLNSDQWHDSVLRVTGENRRALTIAKQLQPLLTEERVLRLQKRRKLIIEGAKKIRKGPFPHLAKALPSIDSVPQEKKAKLSGKDRTRLKPLRGQYEELGKRFEASRSRARRSMSPTTEALFRMNGDFVTGAINDGMAAQEISKLATPQERLDRIYLTVLGRQPTPAEKKKLVPFLTKFKKHAIPDLLWVLIQTVEFQSY